jgi:hypothetical protein
MVWQILQDPAYHHFADSRAFLGIANAADTLSNAAFLIAGALGLIFLGRQRTSGSRHFEVPEEMRAYWILFGAVTLTSFGSAYYHLAPDDARLMWDRLPMSLGFTALLAATVSERIRLTWGLKLLPLLVVIGAGSVVCWRWTGNLLPYTLVQYGSIAVILAIVISFRSRFTHAGYIFGVLALYAAAKASEALDATIYAFGHIVSGHSLKHVLAALAAWWLLRMLKVREPR